MEFTGSVVGITQDYVTGAYTIAFRVNETAQVLNSYDSIKDEKKLVITVKKWRAKRSKNANSYFHALTGKIADVLTISKARCKNILICRYGQPEFSNGQPVIMETQLTEEIMLEQEYLHCIPYKAEEKNGTTFISYYVYRGSHTYDSREMSKLIDGTIAEAKELAIETIPPAELERMLKVWKP